MFPPSQRWGPSQSLSCFWKVVEHYEWGLRCRRLESSPQLSVSVGGVVGCGYGRARVWERWKRQRSQFCFVMMPANAPLVSKGSAAKAAEEDWTSNTPKHTHTLGPATISCWWGRARPPSDRPSCDRPSCPPTRHQTRTPRRREPKLVACESSRVRVKRAGVQKGDQTTELRPAPLLRRLPPHPP